MLDKIGTKLFAALVEGVDSGRVYGRIIRGRPYWILSVFRADRHPAIKRENLRLAMVLDLAIKEGYPASLEVVERTNGVRWSNGNWQPLSEVGWSLDHGFWTKADHPHRLNQASMQPASGWLH